MPAAGAVRELLGEMFAFVKAKGGGGNLAITWRPEEIWSSQWTEGERDPAICGTDMVDVCHMVPGSDGTDLDPRSVVRVQSVREKSG